MDKRRKPLTPHEQLLLRQAMLARVADHPEWELPRLLKEIRKSLQLTLPDMARVGRISVPTLRNLEAGRNSPSIKTVEALLRPLGLKLAVVRQPPAKEMTGKSASDAGGGDSP